MKTSIQLAEELKALVLNWMSENEVDEAKVELRYDTEYEYDDEAGEEFPVKVLGHTYIKVDHRCKIAQIGVDGLKKAYDETTRLLHEQRKLTEQMKNERDSQMVTNITANVLQKFFTPQPQTQAEAQPDV